MQRSVPTSLRVAIALVLLAVVVLYASTVVGRYRSSQAAEAAREPAASAPATATATPKTATPPAAEEGEGEATEADAEKKPASGPAVVVKVDGLNFREEPDKDAKVIRGLDAGERLAVLEQKDGWYYAEDSGGEKGWLYGSEQYSTLEE